MMQTTHTPSLVGVGSTDLGLLGTGGSPKRHRDTPSTVSWNGWSYLVGAGVENFARPIERMDFLRLSDGAELRALTYKTLADLLAPLPPAERSVAILVGLPVEVMSDRALARATRKRLRDWLLGEHACTINRAPFSANVTHVEVLAQPAGAFYAWGFDDRGRWARDKADQQALVGVCDIGFNTLDVFSVQGGQIQGRFTGGDSLGMRRAAELIIQAARREHGITLSKHQADALLRERHPTLFSAGQHVDLSAIVAQAQSSNASSIVTFLEEKWGRGRQFGYVLFTGGGAEALRDTLLQHYPHGSVLPGAVTANAVGLARAARRTLSKHARYVLGLDPGYGGFKAALLAAN